MEKYYFLVRPVTGIILNFSVTRQRKNISTPSITKANKEHCVFITTSKTISLDFYYYFSYFINLFLLRIYKAISYCKNYVSKDSIKTDTDIIFTYKDSSLENKLINFTSFNLSILKT